MLRGRVRLRGWQRNALAWGRSKRHSGRVGVVFIQFIFCKSDNETPCADVGVVFIYVIFSQMLKPTRVGVGVVFIQSVFIKDSIVYEGVNEAP